MSAVSRRTCVGRGEQRVCFSQCVIVDGIQVRSDCRERVVFFSRRTLPSQHIVPCFPPTLSLDVAQFVAVEALLVFVLVSAVALAFLVILVFPYRFTPLRLRLHSPSLALPLRADKTMRISSAPPRRVRAVGCTSSPILSKLSSRPVCTVSHALVLDARLKGRLEHLV